MRQWCFGWVLVLGACPADSEDPACDAPPDSAGEAADTELVMTGGEGCVGPAHIGECCCYDPPKESGLAACVTTYLCPEIELTCPRGDVSLCDDEELEVVCGTGIDCALEVLAADRPGGLQWRITSSTSSTTPGLSQVRHGLFLAGDGTAISVVQSDYDVDPTFESVKRGTLAPASHFTECMTKPSALARFSCMNAVFVGLSVKTCE